jgi:hypothetical protein
MIFSRTRQTGRFRLIDIDTPGLSSQRSLFVWSLPTFTISKSTRTVSCKAQSPPGAGMPDIGPQALGLPRFPTLGQLPEIEILCD